MPEADAIKPLMAISDAPLGVRAGIRRSYMDNCVHRWAYRLAKSPDPVDAVAEAAIGACWGSLEYLNGAMLEMQAELAQKLGRPPVNTEPLVKTGERTTVARANYEWARSQAIFHVVQARAGRCWIY